MLPKTLFLKDVLPLQYFLTLFHFHLKKWKSNLVHWQLLKLIKPFIYHEGIIIKFLLHVLFLNYCIFQYELKKIQRCPLNIKVDFYILQNDKILEELSPSTLMIILNAVYFKGEWSDKFDPYDTKNLTFYNLGKEKNKN